MKVRKVDPISGRVTYLEREQPLAEFRANEEILLPGDVYRVGQDYMDFPPRPEETEAFQMLPFYAGLRRVAGASPAGWWADLWKTVGDWIKDVNEWTGPLGDLWDWLVEKGIVTPAQADKGKDEGWTKEQLIELIRAQMAPAWEKYIPWIIAGGFGIGLLAILLRRPPAPIYIAK